MAGAFEIAGVGLHTGAPVRLTARPASPGGGVTFLREDLDGAAPIPALWRSVATTRLGTEIVGPDGASVRTVEHVMAALALCGVDDAEIGLDGPEAPILDGSAADFTREIRRVGVVHVDAPRMVFCADAPIEVRDGERSLRLEPFEGRVLDVSISFDAAAIGEQRVEVDLDAGAAALDRLARARTFCQRGEIDAMRADGLALGGSLENAIVVDGAEILNDGELRDPMEFALHKALDLVGDLALLGAPVRGRIVAVRPGHDLNAAFVKRLAEAASRFDPTAFDH
ncbi:MAG: UDP-3-O-acyl-N-acetylglucosamine deacetylase [Pseudomonadota bacterium]